MIGWIYLGFAIGLEAAGTTFMKLSEGFEKAVPSALMVILYLLSFGALTLALKTIPISVAYAIWGGVGIILITAIGFLIFKEPITTLKGLAIFMIIAGVVILDLSGGAIKAG